MLFCYADNKITSSIKLTHKNVDKFQITFAIQRFLSLGKFFPPSVYSAINGEKKITEQIKTII